MMLSFKLSVTQEMITTHAGLAFVGELYEYLHLDSLVNFYLPQPGSAKGYLPNHFNWPPAYSGDGAVTIYNPGSGHYTASIGGISKRVNLPTYQAGDTLTARLYIAPTFSDSETNTSFALEFYNASNQLLGTKTGDILFGNSYRWVVIDREPIPTGTTYVKVTPGTHLGATETSSLLWDSLKLELVQVASSGSGQEVTVTIDGNGGVIELPGIGRLDIPAGALSQSTAITMRQIASSPPLEGFTTVSPVVEFEPSGLTFNTPAILTLNTDTTLVGTNHPSLVQTVVNNGSNFEFLKEMVSPEQATLGRGIYLSHFSSVWQVIQDALINYPLQEMCRTDKNFTSQALTANWDTNNSVATVDLNNLCYNPAPANGGDGAFIVYYATSGTYQADPDQVLG